MTSCSPRQDRPARCGSRKTEPPGSTGGSRLPDPATPAASLGQPGILPAHHSRLPRAAQHARRPATSSGNQQLSRRAEGPVRRDIGPWCTLPRHGGLTVTRGLEADAEQRDQTPRTAQSRSARSGDGSSRRLLPAIGSRPSRADVHGAGHHGRHRPRGYAGLTDLGGQRLQPQPSRLPRRSSAYVSCDDRQVNCGLRSAGAQGAPRGAPGGAAPRRATDRRPLPARKLADDHPQVAQTRQEPCRRHRRCVRPQIPGLSPGGLGPDLTASGSPRGLSSGLPFARRVRPLRPPSSGIPSSGVLRFAPFGRCPVPVPLRCPSGFPSP